MLFQKIIVKTMSHLNSYCVLSLLSFNSLISYKIPPSLHLLLLVVNSKIKITFFIVAIKERKIVYFIVQV